jgi:cytochrome c oxidase subunit 2
MLETASPESAELAALFWILTGLTLVPALLYLAVALATALLARARARHDDPDLAAPPPLRPRAGLVPLVVAGALIPTALIVLAFVFTLRTGARVDPPRGEPVMTIDVVAHQFFWEVIYPDHGVEIANELYVPIGQPVRLRLTSADVIHAFWVPRLTRKLDMTPGHVTELVLQADHADVYRGQCYELCGLQHALMAFDVIAVPPEALERWLTERRVPRTEPADALAAEGLDVYFRARCDHCHAIRGVVPPARVGSPGPDLTHLASRRTLAAGVLPNDRGHLGGWILDPQALKPGARMPPTALEPRELHALLHYLGGLR